MNQITQKEFIKLIEEKQENAEKQLYINTTGNGNQAKGIYNLARETGELNGEIKAYKNLISYLNDVEIVLERIETTKRLFVGGEDLHISEEDLKKMFAKAPIMPYIEPKVERVRNDRIRKFETSAGNKVYIDAKEIKYIYYEECRDGEIILAIDEERTFFTKKTVDYNELVKWWKYWKQM